jgi:alkylation response protein AidB-like acyl-CoA dehydrogenase
MTQIDPLAAVESLRAIIARHAAESERLRTLAPPLIAALRDSGLFGFAAPTAVGGTEHGPLAQLEVIEALARIDTATGWSLMISAMLSAIAGAYLPEAGAREVFARGVPTCAGLILPSGSLRPVRGGYELTGRWAFGSGIRHAEWIVTSGVVEPAGPAAASGVPELRMVAVPCSQVVIEDTWFVAGLRGTGSEHYRIEATFVPYERTCEFPDAPVQRGAASFQLPVIALLAPVHMGFALGAARAALDAITAAAPARIKGWSGGKVAQHSAVQMDLGRADTKLRAARALCCEVAALLEDRCCAARELGFDDWREVRAAVTHATDVARDVASFAFHAGGGAALYEANPSERLFRDIHAAAQHIAATDEAYEFAGRVLLGCAEPHPLMAPRKPARESGQQHF